MGKEENYPIEFDNYELALKNENAKKLIFNNKIIGIVVGSQYSNPGGVNPTLFIDLYYDSNNHEMLSYPIVEVGRNTNLMAINPKFKNKELIEYMKELDIISDTIKTVKKGLKKYDIVGVNLEELKLYKPLGELGLKEFKEIDYTNKIILEGTEK